jgi:hypothetical protein
MAITLLTFEEAAHRYQLPLEQLRYLVNTGRIAPVTVNGDTLVDDEEVRRVAGKNNGSGLHWISLQEVTRRYSLSEPLLKRLIKDGLVRSSTLSTETLVAVEDAEPIARRLNRANFQSLEGRPIELTEASQRYHLPFRSLLNWARRGHIRVLGPGRRPTLLDEADVAYTKELAEIRGITKRRALFPTSRQYCPPWVSQ